MTILKNFNQFVLESVGQSDLLPKYFTLPYFVPEDRFESGLLKTNISRKTSSRRENTEGPAKYSSVEEFLAKNPMKKLEKSIIAEIDRVVKFISNNPLTGKKAKASFNMEFDSLEEYIEHHLDPNSESDAPLGGIQTDLPFSTFSIRVDYDIYKNIPVFTFWYDGDLFYYYTIFTLEPNDVVGSGEDHTYITADETIDYMFYETVWRAAIADLHQMDYLEEAEKILEICEDELDEIADDPTNYPKRITNNYLNKKFIKLLGDWIKNDRPFGKKELNVGTIPPFGIMSFPGQSGKVLKFKPGPTENNYRVYLLELPNYEVDKKYLALKFNFDDRYKITSVDSTNFTSGDYWKGNEIWKPLTQHEVNTLYFINNNGRPIWIKELMTA